MEVAIKRRRKCNYYENAAENNNEIIKNACLECFNIINDSVTSRNINSL